MVVMVRGRERGAREGVVMVVGVGVGGDRGLAAA